MCFEFWADVERYLYKILASGMGDGVEVLDQWQKMAFLYSEMFGHMGWTEPMNKKVRRKRMTIYQYHVYYLSAEFEEFCM